MLRLWCRSKKPNSSSQPRRPSMAWPLPSSRPSCHSSRPEAPATSHPFFLKRAKASPATGSRCELCSVSESSPPSAWHSQRLPHLRSFSGLSPRRGLAPSPHSHSLPGHRAHSCQRTSLKVSFFRCLMSVPRGTWASACRGCKVPRPWHIVGTHICITRQERQLLLLPMHPALRFTSLMGFT